MYWLPNSEYAVVDEEEAGKRREDLVEVLHAEGLWGSRWIQKCNPFWEG